MIEDLGDGRQFYVVPGVADLEEGQTKVMIVNGYQLVIGKHKQQIYAFENRCPHQGKELVNGLLRRGQIICPHHGARFDLVTGASQGEHTTVGIGTFHTRILGGEVEVLLPQQGGGVRP